MRCAKQFQIEVTTDEGFEFSLNLENTWFVELDSPSDIGATAVLFSGVLPPGIGVSLAMFDFNTFTNGALGFGGTPTLLGTYDSVIRVSSPLQFITVKITVKDQPLDTVSWNMAVGAPTIVGSNYITATVGGGGAGYNFETALAAFTAADIHMTGIVSMLRTGRSTILSSANLNLTGVVSGLGSGLVALTQYIDAGMIYGNSLATRNFGNPPVNANDSFVVGGGTTYLAAYYDISMQQSAAVANPSNYSGTVTFT